MAEKYIGIARQTLSDRVVRNSDGIALKNPSGKRFRVSEISGSDGNQLQRY